MTAHDNQRPRQSLLGIAFPTTPDTSVNNMPVICAGVNREGKRMSHVDTRGGSHEIIGAGGATAALLAANPHLAPGGLALLTPPDDNGILEWQSEMTPVVVSAAAKAPPCAGVCDNEDGKPAPLGKNSPRRRTAVLRDTTEIERTTDARMISGETSGTRDEGRPARHEAMDEGEDPSMERSGSSDNESADHEDIAEEGWLRGAMSSLC
jgi:hypothetical protein